VLAWVRARQHLGELVQHFKMFSVIGMVVAGYTMLYLLALNLGNIAYVVAIRNASVLITIVLGILWLREKDRAAKLFAGTFIFFGLLLIKVFG